MYVWTAGHNMPGYLPESEPAAFRTRLEALDYTAEELRNVADGWDATTGTAWADEYEDAANRLREHDADVDGDWYETFEDGRIAYWFECVDLPDDEAAAALEGE